MANQPKGTKHEPQGRRSLSGKKIPSDVDRPLFQVVPGPQVTGVKRPFVTDAPVLTPVAIEVAQPVPGQPSRRDRRPALIADAKRMRKALS